MAGKDLTLRDCDAQRAEMLVEEIGKVRCWITGWQAAHIVPGQFTPGTHVPGDDALRQIQIILTDSVAAAKRRSKKA
jgi:hypothetical protein